MLEVNVSTITRRLHRARQLVSQYVVDMTRPGRIREVVEIDIPLAQRIDRMAELDHIQRHIWTLLRDEARAADMEITDVA